MMNNLFEVLDTDFSVSWDVEKLTQEFPINVSAGYDGINADQKGLAHWQYYKETQIYFSRNFHTNFSEEAGDIFRFIVQLQTRCKNLDNRSELLERFVNHRPHPAFITIVKVDPGSEVKIHTDRSRSASVNIGLKHSHAGITHVWDGEILPDVYINDKNTRHSYQMTDGHTYLLNTKQPHCVTPAPGVNLTRFIVSYSVE